MSSPASEVAYLARALKMPRIPKAAKVFAERARDEGWDYEADLAAVLAGAEPPWLLRREGRTLE